MGDVVAAAGQRVNFLHFVATSAGGNMNLNVDAVFDSGYDMYYLRSKPLHVAEQMIDYQSLKAETVDGHIVRFLYS